MKLIPDSTDKITANYWCTWCSQSKFLDELPADYRADLNTRTQKMRARLNEDFLFDDEKGLLTAYDFCGCRGDLIALLDDGWDVTPTAKTCEFGSLILNKAHFPSFAVEGDPAQSLKNLNDRIRALGYRGLGLWIAAQCPKETDEMPEADMEYARKYWIERAKWCHYAGVKYWKIDWGARCGDVAFRKMLTEICHTCAPGLIVEHAWVRWPMDPTAEERLWNTDWQYCMANLLPHVLDCADTFRTYDVIGEFHFVSTLGRMADALLSPTIHPDLKGNDVMGIMNVEHLEYIAAGLGAAQGIMFHQGYRDRVNSTALDFELIFDGAMRVVRWNRIAAPFSIFKSENHLSKEILCDQAELDQSDWPWFKGLKKAYAPASMSRNCALPQASPVTEGGDIPFVCASKYPEGPLAIATLPRTLSNAHISKPVRADVTIDGVDPDQPVGIFGLYNSLKIVFTEDISARKVYAQDLLADEAEDCTGAVTIHGNTLILSGDWIDRTGLAARTHENDTSEPGLILKLS